jgi:hypothetical protein
MAGAVSFFVVALSGYQVFFYIMNFWKNKFMNYDHVVAAKLNSVGFC